jgi:hypothetical protein
MPAADAGLAGQRVSFSRPARKAIFLIWAGLLWLLLISGAADSAGVGWLRVLAGLAAAGATLYIWRVLRLAIVAEPQRLTIRNLRNTHRIPWHDVEAIYEPGPVPQAVYLENPLAKRKTGLFVRVADGSVISVSLFAANVVGGRNSYFKDVAGVIAALEELRGRYG